MSLFEAEAAHTLGERKHKEFSNALRGEEREGKEELSSSSLHANAWCAQPLLALFMEYYTKESRECPDGV